MPAPIYDLVAEELNLDPDRSRKLVRAMIREIRKRAHKGSGVRVPGLGAFRADGDTIVFQPEPSLARTVNQRFQGLDEESIASGAAESSEGGPTTITRGFEMGSWDPLDTGAAESESSSEAAPDTDEFQAADTDEFQAPDTDEFDAPPDEVAEDSAEPSSGAPSDEAGDASTEPTSPPESAAEEGTSSRFDWQDTSTAQGTQQEAEPDGADAPAESESPAEPASPRPASAEQSSAEPPSSSPEGRPVEEGRAEEPGVEEPGVEEPDVSQPGIEEPVADRPSEQTEADAPEPVSDEPAAGTAEDPSESPEIHDMRESGDASEPDASESEEDEFAMPGLADAERDARDEEDEGPNIWESDFSWDFSSVSSEDVDEESGTAEPEEHDDASTAREPAEASSGPDTPTGRASSGSSSSGSSSSGSSSSGSSSSGSSSGADADSPREPSRSIFDFDESDFESDTARQPAPEESQEPEDTPTQTSTAPGADRGPVDTGETERSSSLPTVLTVMVILILIAMGAWILLGQQGVLPPPQETLGLGGDAAPRSQPAASTETGTPSDDDASPAPSTSTSGESASADAASGTSGTSSSTSDQAFDRAAGGFTIVVASRTSEQAARDLLPDYRQQFSDQGYAVDVVSGTSNGVTRYRVGVGQFPSRSEARTFLDQNQDRLPQGAWPTSIQ